MNSKTQLNEGLKNKVLGWLGVKSTMTEIEDIIDLTTKIRFTFGKDKKKLIEQRNTIANKVAREFVKKYAVSDLPNRIERNGKIVSEEEVKELILHSFIMRITRKNYMKNQTKYDNAIDTVVDFMTQIINNKGLQKFNTKQEEQRTEWARKLKSDRDEAERKKKEKEEWEQERKSYSRSKSSDSTDTDAKRRFQMDGYVD